MASTPLYKAMKENGTSFYAFPGASEDISTYQDDNLSMSFDKFVLLDIPKQVTGTAPSKLDFDNAFYDNQAPGSVPADFKDQLIESLRNYVANYEVSMKETKLSGNEYYYDNTVLNTPTEKIFWKWCRKLGILDLELANSQDEYFGDLQEFESNDLADAEYFPEYLWRERELENWNVSLVFQGTASGTYSQPLTIQFDGQTNIDKGDYLIFASFSNSNLTDLNGKNLYVIESIDATNTTGQQVKLDYTYTGGSEVEETGYVTINYEKLVKYIGEITSVSNVVNNNKSYTEVIAAIGSHQGETPDVLFRTKTDDNYKPNQQFPLLPSQFQPEIIGAENFTSPIRSNPQNYPGDYWGQFDESNYTYDTSSGDSLRRSGEYYGVSGDVYDPVIDNSNLDGISLDFNTEHYVKMNIINREVSNFDEFNALDVNNEPPKDFKFNAILWYYTVTDNNGNVATNLYGIEFLDNPDNNPNPDLDGLKIPTYDKYVATETQDGTSYNFSLNLNYYITNDQVTPSFDPNNINSLFSFQLYNDAMRKLASANDSFNKIISEQSVIEEQINSLTQLIYTQTDLQTINNRIAQLNELLNLYSTLQLVSTDTIEVVRNDSSSPPVIELNDISSRYDDINNILTTSLYTDTQVVPFNVNIPEKDFMINISNNDTTQVEFTNSDDKLTVVLSEDLLYKQSVDIVIDATDDSTQNKKLDIWIQFSDGSIDSLPVLTPFITDIDLPIYYNEDTQLVNSSRTWENKNIDINLDEDFYLLDNETMVMGISDTRGLQVGDYLVVNNMFIGSTTSNNYSGQYRIKDIDSVSNVVEFDITNNVELVNLANANTLPYYFYDNSSIDLVNSQIYVNFNKGVKYTITRISDDDSSTIEQRYLITQNNIN